MRETIRQWLGENPALCDQRAHQCAGCNVERRIGYRDAGRRDFNTTYGRDFFGVPLFNPDISPLRRRKIYG